MANAGRLSGILCWVAACGLEAAEVTVRLYSQHPPVELRLLRGGVVTRITAAHAARKPVEAAGSYEIAVNSEPAVRLRHPLRISSVQGRLGLTLRLPLEDYVSAVLAGESASFGSEEALKAMAVAARTYAARFAGRHKLEGFDFCDTTHCQDFRVSAETSRLRAAAEATEGEMLWYLGSPAATYYTQSCGGSSEDAARLWPDARAPYLRQHADGFCPRQEWQAEILKADLPGALSVVSRTPSGRVERLRVDGVLTAAPAFRFSVGRTLGWHLIRGDLYEVRDGGDRWVFRGRGAGHGVGMCQAGAARMGSSGHGYRQILEFYYPGTLLGLTARGLTWRAVRGERVELLTAQARTDLVDQAERLVRELEERTRLRFLARPRIREYPDVATFRDATGEPGWVAASTRGGVIRLYPAGRMALRHELLHLLVDRPGLPLWFREGLALYLSGKVSGLRPAGGPPSEEAFEKASTRGELQRVYDAALAFVTALVKQHGEETVLSWVERGIPPGAVPPATPAAATR
ncbi:MAG: SpoIID/LytB domain-containing protein [Candidatus Solibacter usitatus]|nr:SpoIID/LytB domain-containing protein [Candidatus Solibacter usitatus]